MDADCIAVIDDFHGSQRSRCFRILTEDDPLGLDEIGLTVLHVRVLAQFFLHERVMDDVSNWL